MGFYASSCLVEEQTPLKNRVVGSERFSSDRARLQNSQLSEPHQEPTLIVTIFVSGRWSFWTVDSFEGFRIDPLSLHKYLYTAANPVAFADPSGQGLMEEIIVVSLMFVLTVTMHTCAEHRTEQLYEQTTKAELDGIELALKMYEGDNGTYPTTSQGLRALIEQPTGPPPAKNWHKDGYIGFHKFDASGAPADAWGHAYEYAYDPKTHEIFYVFSVGPDGVRGTSDDIGLPNH